MMAADIAPGMNRSFLAEEWKHLVPRKCWYDANEEAQDRINLNIETDIQGFDIDPEALKAARANAKMAGVDKLIHFQQRAVKDLRHPKPYGFIITNPPYGERLEEKENLTQLYREIGESYERLDKWSMYLITSYEKAENDIGRKADKNRKIYNGMLKTYYYQFLGPRPPKKNRSLSASVIAKNQNKKRIQRIMKKIIFATGNQDKMREIREILADMDVEVVSMKEAGIHAAIVEDGSTFEENAVIKAKTICELTGEITLADDSGLEIDYLNKEPGIYSARYMGEDTSYHIKNASLIERLNGVPDEKRTARFVCAVAAAFPDGSVKTVRGTMEGRIGYEEKGENGFGYDPIFYLPEYGCTSAELSGEEKNKISHRGKALRAIKDELK